MKRSWLLVLSFFVEVLCLATHTNALARGGGGCFEEGTPVLTRRGPVAIEQLRVGDEVEGGRVAAAYQVQPDEYLELPNGVHVTPEHPFQIAPGTFRTAALVFPNAPRVPAEKPAYNLMISPGGTYTAGGYRVHNKGCFLPDTPILRADHSSTAISHVQVGERLLAFESDGSVVETAVRSVITREADGYLLVRTDQAELRVTREHPFYVGEGTFKTLEVLHVGDTIFAFDGTGLTAQVIRSIEPVPGKITVYNLQTDAPNTYFAAGIAVHTKGGGGGGGRSSSRSSFHSRSHSHYSSGPGRPLDKVETCFMLFFMGIVLVLIAVFIYSARKGAAGNLEEELDYCYSRKAIDGKAVKTQKLLEFIVQRGDDSFALDMLRQRARETFVKLQECWQERSYNDMRKLLLPDLYEDHCKQLSSMRRNHEINMIDHLKVEAVDIVNVRRPVLEHQREFTALITASAVDYYVDDRTNVFLRGDRCPARFQEFWTFQRQDGGWLLREIEQTRESDLLKEENFCEPLNEQELRRIYGEAGAGSSEAGPELHVSSIDRLLNALEKTDALWNSAAMRSCARKTYFSVIAAREAGEPDAVHEDELFPAVAADLREKLAKAQDSGLTSEYRNLCVRKVELVHVRNFANNSQDEFTARISVHAQIIIYRNSTIVRQDKDVRAFVEYWTFGRQENQWKLKEVLSSAAGREAEAAESMDEEDVLRQIAWDYRPPA